MGSTVAARGMARQARTGMAGYGAARRGKAGEDWHGWAWTARQCRHGEDWHGWARRGEARHDEAGET